MHRPIMKEERLKFLNPEVITTTGKSLRITQIRFNIIYIMRTDVVVGKLRCRVLIIPVGTQTFLTCNRITISVRLFSSDF